MCHHVCRGEVLCLIQKPGNDRVSSFFIIVAYEAPATRGECSVWKKPSDPTPTRPCFVFFCLHPLFISELFISHSIPDFFFSLVEILPQSVLRNPPGPAKTRWNAERGAAGQAEVRMIPFFFPSFFWTTLVKVCFIYTAASHNKSDLMTLSKYSRSRFKS